MSEQLVKKHFHLWTSFSLAMLLLQKGCDLLLARMGDKTYAYFVGNRRRNVVFLTMGLIVVVASSFASNKTLVAFRMTTTGQQSLRTTTTTAVQEASKGATAATTREKKVCSFLNNSLISFVFLRTENR